MHKPLNVRSLKCVLNLSQIESIVLKQMLCEWIIDRFVNSLTLEIFSENQQLVSDGEAQVKINWVNLLLLAINQIDFQISPSLSLYLCFLLKSALQCVIHNMP